MSGAREKCRSIARRPERSGDYPLLTGLQGFDQEPRTENGSSRYKAYFAATLAFICSLTLYVGFPHSLSSYGHDSFFFLDNAYRVLRGQIPYADFSTAFGPLIFQIHASGLALSSESPDGLGYANALWGAAIAIWAAFVARYGMPALTAYVIGVYTLCLIVAPFPLGNNPSDFGFAMTYNRYGYAILGIIILEGGARFLSENLNFERGGALSTGIALGLLAFLKITYFLTGALFAFLSLIALDRKEARERTLLMLCGFLPLSLLFLIQLKFALPEMLEDLTNAAISRRMTLRPFTPVQWIDLLPISLLVAFSFLIYGAERRSAFADYGTGRRAIFFALLVVAAGYLTLVTNQQASSFPLNGYAAVVLAETYRAIERKSPAKLLSGQFADAFPRQLLVGVTIAPLCFLTFFSLLVASSTRLLEKQNQEGVIESPARGDRLVFAKTDMDTETTGYAYVAAIQDGLALLKRHIDENEGVLAFDEFNPFNYLLGRPSPRGGISAAAYAYTFHDSAHPSAARFFGNTSYVLVRRYLKKRDAWETVDVNALLRIYGNTLHSEFALLAKTDHWELWGRRTPGTSSE